MIAHHVDHGHRPGTSAEADRAEQIARQVQVEFRCHRAELRSGPNFEATARAARRQLIGPDAMTGHTLDDLAETVLYRMFRGSGPDGLAAMGLGPVHPILHLRRSDTLAICAFHNVEPIFDETNSDATIVRNRLRHELIPLANDILGRDVAPNVARTSELAGMQRRAIDELTAEIDPTDARTLALLPIGVAECVLRRWAQGHHPENYPPDRNALTRMLAVVRGEVHACELAGGLRVERSGGRLRITRG